MRLQQSADRQKTQNKERTVLDAISDSDDGEATDIRDKQWSEGCDALDKPDIKVCLGLAPTALASFEQMAMPSTRISHARNTSTEHARCTIQLTESDPCHQRPCGERR